MSGTCHSLGALGWHSFKPKRLTVGARAPIHPIDRYAIRDSTPALLRMPTNVEHGPAAFSLTYTHFAHPWDGHVCCR